MKCSGATGSRLENFRDVKVGVCQEPVDYRNSTSFEPYPTLKDEDYVFRGGKDANGKFKGKGSIEFENGDLISGTFIVRAVLMPISHNLHFLVKICLLPNFAAKRKSRGF